MNEFVYLFISDFYPVPPSSPWVTSLEPVLSWTNSGEEQRRISIKMFKNMEQKNMFVTKGFSPHNDNSPCVFLPWMLENFLLALWSLRHRSYIVGTERWPLLSPSLHCQTVPRPPSLHLYTGNSSASLSSSLHWQFLGLNLFVFYNTPASSSGSFGIQGWIYQN